MAGDRGRSRIVKRVWHLIHLCGGSRIGQCANYFVSSLNKFSFWILHQTGYFNFKKIKQIKIHSVIYLYICPHLRTLRNNDKTQENTFTHNYIIINMLQCLFKMKNSYQLNWYILWKSTGMKFNFKGSWPNADDVIAYRSVILGVMRAFEAVHVHYA